MRMKFKDKETGEIFTAQMITWLPNGEMIITGKGGSIKGEDAEFVNIESNSGANAGYASPSSQGSQNGGNVIDVWKIKTNDSSGGYYEHDIAMVVEMLKDCDYEDGYTITRHKMLKEDYEKLPEFDGF